LKNLGGENLRRESDQTNQHSDTTELIKMFIVMEKNKLEKMSKKDAVDY